VIKLLILLLASILEDISFTRKDGQYLRWDSRSVKAKNRDQSRLAKGKKPYNDFYKKEIYDVREALLKALERVIGDIRVLKQQKEIEGKQKMIPGSSLEILPTLAENQFDAVITSPPYCNRYDYTRTYALELAFLGMDNRNIINLRQEQLSCTVENRSKHDRLRLFYSSIEREKDFETVYRVVQTNPALQETFLAIRKRHKQGFLNNKGVVQMIEGYFTELAFVISELYRVCRSGGHVAIVNDNVRYGGEIIPVDLLLTEIAVNFGFKPKSIYVLEQRKGNSSQQMGKFGREALRKSILVWEK
jgi:site-specific DNA-methyltransferase (cytosine-N4-specific)